MGGSNPLPPPAGDKCPSTELELLLTACSAEQYTCHDGTCIRKMQRCDLEVNCPDQSDERLCTPVVVPPDYISEVSGEWTERSGCEGAGVGGMERGGAWRRWVMGPALDEFKRGTEG